MVRDTSAKLDIRIKKGILLKQETTFSREKYTGMIFYQGHHQLSPESTSKQK